MKKMIHTFRPRLLALSLTLFFVALFSQANAQTVIQVGTGSVAPSVGTNPSNGANGASPYGICVGSGNMGKIVQIIYTPSDINTAMTAAGYAPGASFISTTSWDISSNIGSTSYNHAGYTIKMANIAATSFTGTTPYSGSMTQVFNGNVSWASSGTGYMVTNTLPTPFLWDGTSSLLVQVCYTISGVGLAKALMVHVGVPLPPVIKCFITGALPYHVLLHRMSLLWLPYLIVK